MTTKAQCRVTSVALTVMAVTALAISSAPVGQTMQPNQISHLGLWLSASDLAKEYADGRPVTRWPDRSGKRDGLVVAEQPLVAQRGQLLAAAYEASRRVEVVTAGQDRVRARMLTLHLRARALRHRKTQSARAEDQSAVFLVRPTLVYGPAPAPDVAWSKNRYLFISHVSNYDTRVSVQIVEGTGEVRLLSRPQPKQKIDQNSSFADGRQLALSGDAWHRLMVTVDYKAKQSRIVIDGTVLVRALPRSSLDVFEDVPSPITGIGSNTLDDWLSCQVAELICYQKALEIDELQSLDAYLFEKYGLKK